MRLVYLLYVGGSSGTDIPQNTLYLSALAQTALRSTRENSGAEKY